MSIFAAVASQTIAGLAQGRPIKGNTVYLGGPLTFLSQLRVAFDNALHTKGLCPEHSLYFVALGAAMSSQDEIDMSRAIEEVNDYSHHAAFRFIEPLFQNEAEYDEFVRRHSSRKAPRADLNGYEGDCYLGIDSGSTTVKAVLLDDQGRLLSSMYHQQFRDPVPIIRDYLLDLFRQHPHLRIKSGAVTGYGEELMKNAFAMDYGIVETVAHFTAAKTFMPDVDFVIDIGGQDMKCFKIRNGAIDNIFLNEACSSGCGSFLQTFASTLGCACGICETGALCEAPGGSGVPLHGVYEFQREAGSKDGATTADISAGLSVSVVKNAIYKVIRAPSAEDLGRRIVVQGGRFLNDAVLRVFEKELGVEVIRPDISGLMGAYGAAVYAREKGGTGHCKLTLQLLENFTHEVKVVNCGLCSNHCRLTVNLFGDGRRYIGGNRCEKPVTHRKSDEKEDLNILTINCKRCAPWARFLRKIPAERSVFPWG